MEQKAIVGAAPLWVSTGVRRGIDHYAHTLHQRKLLRLSDHS